MSYMFEDTNWVSKLLLGVVISMVPILNIAWFGYGIGIMRNMARGMANPLPSWDNLGEKIKDGLIIFVVSFVYLLPALIVVGIGIGITVASGDDNVAGAVWIVLGCCLSVYILAFSFLYPAILIHYSRTDSFGSLFQVREIIKLATANMGDYLLSWVTGLLAGTVLSVVAPVLVLLCVVPFLLGIAWVNCVSFYAYGQVGLSAVAKSQV